MASPIDEPVRYVAREDETPRFIANKLQVRLTPPTWPRGRLPSQKTIPTCVLDHQLAQRYCHLCS